MASEIITSTIEANFLNDAIKHGLRVDGRTLTDQRNLIIKLGPAQGQATVHLGNTKVIAVVSGTIIEPNADRPNEGTLSIFVDFNPMASASNTFDPLRSANQSTEQNIFITRTIERSIKESRPIDLEALCIIPGNRVWSIRLDIHLIDHGGNLIDTANIAALAALLHFRRADVTVSGSNITVHSMDSRESVALSLHHLPICLSFAIFHKGAAALLDPTLIEEELSESKVTVIMNSAGELCGIHKLGGVGMDVEGFLKCFEICKSKSKELSETIKNKVNEAINANTVTSIKQGKLKQEQPIV